MLIFHSLVSGAASGHFTTGELSKCPHNNNLTVSQEKMSHKITFEKFDIDGLHEPLNF